MCNEALKLFMAIYLSAGHGSEMSALDSLLSESVTSANEYLLPTR